jgi:hypothetical protein
VTEVFEAKLRRIGNSLGIIIPAELIDEMDYHEGDVVKVMIPPADIEQRNQALLGLAGIYRGKRPFRREKGDRY